MSADRGRLAAALLLAALALPPAKALAQATREVVVADSTAFLPRFDFNVSLEALSGRDPRFSWDADFGGEFDVVGGPSGRLTTVFNYETICGDELQPFDPNQGNYLIEVFGGWRRREVETALVFHHTSRHLGDRAKDFGIAWNLLGPQVTWTRRRGNDVLQARGRALKIVMIDYVDYSAEFSGDVLYARHVSPRTALVARGSAVVRTIDRDLSDRDAQVGGRVELAWRVYGGRAQLEVYGGVERRIEADAFEARPITWALAGLRLGNRD